MRAGKIGRQERNLSSPEKYFHLGFLYILTNNLIKLQISTKLYTVSVFSFLLASTVHSTIANLNIIERTVSILDPLDCVYINCIFLLISFQRYQREMGVFAMVLFITCISTIWSARFPRWPQEFRWSSAGPINGWTCTRILEVADPDTWDDNYFCYRSSPHIRGVGMRWSSAGNCIVNSRSSHLEVSFHEKF